MSLSILGLFFALGSPLFFGIMNTIDKYVVSYRVKRPLGFAIVASWVGVLGGIIVSFFADWSNLSFGSLLFPIIVGIIGGVNFFLYYILMQKQDASNLTGLVYFYPVLVAILSFFVLHERFSFLSYLGLFFIVSGVVMISARLNKLKLHSGFFLIFINIVLVALWEFSIKIITNQLPPIAGFAIASIVTGLTTSTLLFFKRIRKDFLFELKNFKWALIAESFTFFATITIYLAMNLLPATIVSSLASLHPMFTLIFERISSAFFGRVSKDHLLLPKLGAIVLIVLGAILLTINS